MTFYLHADLTFVCVDPTRDTDDEFDTFTDAVTDALYDLAEVDDGIIDPDITVKITDRWASIHMGITADTEADAVRSFPPTSAPHCTPPGAAPRTGRSTSRPPRYLRSKRPDSPALDLTRIRPTHLAVGRPTTMTTFVQVVGVLVMGEQYRVDRAGLVRAEDGAMVLVSLREPIG